MNPNRVEVHHPECDHAFLYVLNALEMMYGMFDERGTGGYPTAMMN